ncbi:probable CoA ligase CCL8 isoform X2 [Cryptomeria japonica]|nr:probable CoA ligase CCL8 isoform X2 [Cryptomeria japonica]XP_057868413.2 probable CoA ligase CCL8 isoform X2 [Cryptomeria japonica]
MEVIKAALRMGCGAQKRLAVAAAQENHSYGQLLASAWQLSNILLEDSSANTSRDKSIVHANSQSTHSMECNQSTNETELHLISKVKGTSISSLSGARIGIVAKPSAEFVAGMWATWIGGGVVVPLALSHPETEILYVMDDAKISVIVGTKEYQELLEGIAGKCSVPFCLIPVFPNLPAYSEPSMSNEFKVGASSMLFEDILANVEKYTTVDGDGAALIVYTSGTTGKPKGVVHTHASIAAQVQILTEAWEYTPADRFLNCLPLHHVHGLYNALLAPLYAGAVVDFIPKFSAREVWQRWIDSYPSDGSKAKNAITVFTGVPTMYTRLLQAYELMGMEAQKVAASAAHKLRLMMCGSSALPHPVMKKWERITGHCLLERYGMTEFVMALSNPLHGPRKVGTVGKPLPGVQIKIISEPSDNHNEPGTGELCVKSPSMFKEYWRKPQVTKESFGFDGYFKTGDTATIDADGYCVILGRTNVDILKVGGYKLSALEIEATLLEHPDVVECSVLGIPDTVYGEIICAVVVPKTEAQRIEANSKPVITIQDLHKWAKERIAPYKIPQTLHVWESLPRNAMGKVNKKELKELLLSS